MNLPNLLTLSRIFLVPLVVVALVQDDFGLRFQGFPVANEFIALALFLAAAATDLLDGYLARKWGQVTTVGTLLDPIADKLLISAALISLVQVRMIPGWIAILIVSREFAVNGLRAIAAAEGYTIKASDLGKTKMVSQVAAIAMMLVAIRLPEWRAPAMWMMYGVVVFGVVSALQYFAKFWSKVDHRTKARRRRELLLMERRQRRAAKAQASAAEKVGPPTVHG